jgi:hypothetical protein
MNRQRTLMEPRARSERARFVTGLKSIARYEA